MCSRRSGNNCRSCHPDPLQRKIPALLFNSDPQVIDIGYTRLVIIFSAYIFSLLYEIMSGYLRGFGISFVPALLTTIGVCGTRIAWVYAVFPNHRSFPA